MMTEYTPAPVTGADLIDWGHRPGPQFPALLARANAARAEGLGLVRIRRMLEPALPPPAAEPLALRPPGEVPLHVGIRAGDADEQDNIDKVLATMAEVLKTPTVEAGAVMPDACPAGPLGTIPVGGAVAARNAIHPGMHSADICCSVMTTDPGPVDPKAALDATQAITHFRPGGHDQGNRFAVSLDLMDQFRANPFLSDGKMLHAAQAHMGTQGDGNHFLFIGRSHATGRVAMVTHHGSGGRAGCSTRGAWKWPSGSATPAPFRRPAGDARCVADRHRPVVRQACRLARRGGFPARRDARAMSCGLQGRCALWIVELRTQGQLFRRSRPLHMFSATARPSSAAASRGRRRWWWRRWSVIREVRGRRTGDRGVAGGVRG